MPGVQEGLPFLAVTAPGLEERACPAQGTCGDHQPQGLQHGWARPHSPHSALALFGIFLGGSSLHTLGEVY